MKLSLSVLFSTILFAVVALVFFGSAAHAEQARTQVVQKASVSAAAASGVTSAATSTVSVTVPGARLGDACVASHSTDTTGLVLGCQVTATDTAKVTVLNVTTNGAALSSGTTRVFLMPKGTQ